jgi:hypothetical protein
MAAVWLPKHWPTSTIRVAMIFMEMLLGNRERCVHHGKFWPPKTATVNTGASQHTRIRPLHLSYPTLGLCLSTSHECQFQT